MQSNNNNNNAPAIDNNNAPAIDNNNAPAIDVREDQANPYHPYIYVTGRQIGNYKYTGLTLDGKPIFEIFECIVTNPLGMSYRGKFDKEGTPLTGKWSITPKDGKESVYNNYTPTFPEVWKQDYLCADGTKYTGGMVGDEKEGYGLVTYPDGTSYEGEFKDDKKHGVGVFTNKHGTKYYGCFGNDEMLAGGWRIRYKEDLAILVKKKITPKFARPKIVEVWETTPNILTNDDGIPNIEKVWMTNYVLDDGAIYTGQMLGNEISGHGTLTTTDGYKYEGVLVDRKLDGHGTITHPNGNKYEGKFKNGKMYGSGYYHYPDGTIFETIDDHSKLDNSNEKIINKFIPQKDFTQLIRTANGNVFIGNFTRNYARSPSGVEMGNIKGPGKMTTPDGTVYEGKFSGGNLTYGRCYYKNGDTYKGLFHNYEKSLGTLTTTDGIIYSGEFKDEKYHGEGCVTYPDGSRYFGNFVEGMKHGEGKYYSADGTKFSETYKDGNLVTSTQIVEQNVQLSQILPEESKEPVKLQFNLANLQDNKAGGNNLTNQNQGNAQNMTNHVVQHKANSKRAYCSIF